MANEDATNITQERQLGWKEQLSLANTILEIIAVGWLIVNILLWVFNAPNTLILISFVCFVPYLFTTILIYLLNANNRPTQSLSMGLQGETITASQQKQISEGRIQTAEPNIIFLRSLRLKVEFDEDDIARWVIHGDEARVAEFVNEKEQGRSVGAIDNVKAVITYKSPEHVFNVYYGYWLNEKYIETYFGLGSVRQLLIALETNEGIWAVENHHESPDRYHPKIGALMTAERYLVEVRLIGGAESEFIKDFYFTLQCKPTLELDPYEPRESDLTRTEESLPVGVSQAKEQETSPSTKSEGGAEIGQINCGISDEDTGRGIRGVTITAWNVQTKREYTGATDKYGALNLSVTHGFYDVTIEARNYYRQIQAIKVGEQPGLIMLRLQKTQEHHAREQPVESQPKEQEKVAPNKKESTNRERHEARALTPEYLIELYEKRHSARAQETQEAQSHLNQWAEVSGFVGNVHHLFSKDGWWIILSNTSGYPVPVFTFFDESWADRLKALKPGDPIKVRGQIQEIFVSARIVMNNCELLDA
jgi:hypothetical protein